MHDIKITLLSGSSLISMYRRLHSPILKNPQLRDRLAPFSNFALNVLQH